MDIARTNVAAVIRDEEGRVLLCKRALYKKVAPGMWHMPGGKIEDGETIQEAITRELKEELDLDVMSVKETPVEWEYKVGEEMHRTKFVVATVTGTPVLNNEENVEFAYVAVNDIKNYLEADRYQITVEAAGYK